MNKVFKVIWSDARSAYVVVSEIAKNHGSKSCSTKKLLAMLIAAGVMTCASVAPAMAAPTVDDSAKVNVGKKAEVAVADNAKVNVDEKIAIGIGANAKGACSVAIGNNAVVTGLGGVAVGYNSEGAENSVALGSNVKAAGFNSVAIGNSAKTSDLHSIAIGYNSESSKASAIAIGNEAKATNQNSFAFGQKANASGESSVAFGNGSKATHLIAIAIGSGAEATDEETIAIGGSAKATSQYSVAIGNHIDNTGEKAVAIGQQTMAYGNHSIAVGAASQAKYTGATAIGTFATATQEGSIALGYNSHADREAGIKGYDPLTGKESTLTSLAWQSGKGALSIGNAGGTRQIINVAAGSQDTDAVNVAQLKKVAVEAGKHTTLIAGDNVTLDKKETDKGLEYTVKAVDTKYTAGNGIAIDAAANNAISVNLKNGENNLVVDENGLALSNKLTGIESISNGDAKLTLSGFATELANGQGASVKLFNDTTTINNKVTVYNDGRISGVAAGIHDTDAVNVGQLKAVGTTANMGWNLATNGVAIEATNVKPGDFVDFSGDKNISVSHDGTKVQVELNKDIDVNSVQTNALNSKYNLSVGTMAENGIMPFFVNSTGDFYAAHNKFHVDKDGKVTATAGEIGNVVLQNGVYTGHSALRDGELFVGDASGNYSQITTKGAKLGKVTVDKAGQIHNVTAGTADEDAVNVSQLNKATASSKTTVSKGTNTTVTSTVAEDGHTDYKVNLNKELEGIESISNGDAKINLNDTGVVISKGNDKTFSITDTGMGMSVIGDDYVERSIMVGKTGTVISGGLSVAGSKITNVAAGTADTDAVNYGQLKKAVSEGNTDSHIKAGEYEVGADNKVSMDIVDKNGQSTGEKVTIKDVAKASDVGDVSKIDKDIQNIKGNTTVVDAVNNVNNKVGDLNYNQVAKGDLVNGDNTTTAIGKLNQKLSDVEKTAGAHSTVSTDDSGNISVTPTKDEKTGATDYKVSLNKDLKLDSVKVGENVSLTKDGLTAGNTKVTNAGLSIGDKTYVSKDGLNANKQTITNVANGKVEKDSTDAVNGGQLYETNQAIANNATNISSLSHSISNLDNRVNKVGAGAAALAALHPLDFDPDAKWDFAAGYGNYRGANAAAVGAYYRPNEDTMFSVGGTFGNGENMVNAGVSFKLGSGSSHVSTSRVAMAKEIKELRGELEAMKSAMLDANAGKKIDTSKLQLFPDVPQNHWAYEYVAQLAGNGMIEGYPDGNFAGDRPMTRYEFAAILYRAMTKGAVLSDKILSEFSHELEYFTVDTIAKDKAGNPTIQRVRTVKENKNK